MSDFRFPVAVAAFAATLAVSSTIHAAPAEPVALDTSVGAADLAPRLLEITDAAAAKGIAKVALPLFTVQFVTADDVSGETSGSSTTGRAHLSAGYTLVNVGEADFAALAEQLYASVVKGLRANGVDVVPVDAVLAAPTWRKMAAGGTPSPLRTDTAVTVAPHAMAIYGVNRVTAKKGGGLFAALSGMADVASAIGAGVDAPQLQQELGGAALLEADVKVHFVKLTNHNKGFLGRLDSSARVSHDAYPSIVQARFTLRNGMQTSTFALKQPLALDPSAITDVRKEAATGGEIAGAVVAGLIRMAAGNKDRSSSERYQAVADPGRYRAVVGQGLETLGAMVTTQITLSR